MLQQLMLHKTEYYEHWARMLEAKTDEDRNRELLLRDECAKKALQYASYQCLHSGIQYETSKAI